MTAIAKHKILLLVSDAEGELRNRVETMKEASTVSARVIGDIKAIAKNFNSHLAEMKDKLDPIVSKVAYNQILLQAQPEAIERVTSFMNDCVPRVSLKELALFVTTAEQRFQSMMVQADVDLSEANSKPEIAAVTDRVTQSLNEYKHESTEKVRSFSDRVDSIAVWVSKIESSWEAALRSLSSLANERTSRITNTAAFSVEVKAKAEIDAVVSESLEILKHGPTVDAVMAEQGRVGRNLALLTKSLASQSLHDPQLVDIIVSHAEAAIESIFVKVDEALARLAASTTGEANAQISEIVQEVQVALAEADTSNLVSELTDTALERLAETEKEARKSKENVDAALTVATHTIADAFDTRSRAISREDSWVATAMTDPERVASYASKLDVVDANARDTIRKQLGNVDRKLKGAMKKGNTKTGEEEAKAEAKKNKISARFLDRTLRDIQRMTNNIRQWLTTAEARHEMDRLHMEAIEKITEYSKLSSAVPAAAPEKKKKKKRQREVDMGDFVVTEDDDPSGDEEVAVSGEFEDEDGIVGSNRRFALPIPSTNLVKWKAGVGIVNMGKSGTTGSELDPRKWAKRAVARHANIDMPKPSEVLEEIDL